MAEEQPVSPTVSAAPVPRRKFLILGGVLVAVLASIGGGFVALMSYAPPFRRWVRTMRFGLPHSPIATTESIPPGEWTIVVVDTGGLFGNPNPRVPAVWVRRDRDKPDVFRVLSASCTHAGCRVEWQKEEKQFACPCHGGKFDPEGNRKSGPPRRALDPLEYIVKKGQLFVPATEA